MKESSMWSEMLDIDTVGQNAGGTLENNQALSNEELAKVYTRPV